MGAAAAAAASAAASAASASAAAAAGAVAADAAAADDAADTDSTRAAAGRRCIWSSNGRRDCRDRSNWKKARRNRSEQGSRRTTCRCWLDSTHARTACSRIQPRAAVSAGRVHDEAGH